MTPHLLGWLVACVFAAVMVVIARRYEPLFRQWLRRGLGRVFGEGR